MLRHWKGTPANGCSGCGQDFTSTTLFDRHQVGTYEYTLERGLKLDPPREDAGGPAVVHTSPISCS